MELAVDALSNSKETLIENRDPEVLPKADFHEIPINSTDTAVILAQSENHEESLETDDESMDGFDSKYPPDNRADQVILFYFTVSM